MDRINLKFLNKAAPVVYAKIYNSFNESYSRVYNAIILSKIGWHPVVMWIDKIAWIGWSGRMCEFGGILFGYMAASYNTHQFTAGPLCNRQGSPDEFIILRRQLYLYGGRVIVYSYNKLFTIILELHATVPLKQAFFLPFCLPIDGDRFIRKEGGSIYLKDRSNTASDKCKYEFIWRADFDMQVEILPLCIPSAKPLSLSIAINSLSKDISHEHIRGPFIHDFCQQPEFNVSTINHGVKYIMSSSCCWLEPILRISHNSHQVYHINDVGYTQLSSTIRFSSVQIQLVSISQTKLLFSGVGSAYLRLLFQIQSVNRIELTIDDIFPCMKYFNSPHLLNKSSADVYEWKTYGIAAYVTITKSSCTTGVYMNMSYSIENYTSLAHDWQIVSPNRVFSPSYIEPYEYLQTTISLPYRYIQVQNHGW